MTYVSSGKKPTVAAELNLWHSTRPRLREAGFLIVRIETSTAEGVPDVWVGKGELGTWLENKAAKAWPMRATSKVFGSHGLRPEQVTWLVAAAQRGCRAFIWAGVGVGHLRQTFLVPCTEAERFNDMTKGELMLYACSYEQLIERLQCAGVGYP